MGVIETVGEERQSVRGRLRLLMKRVTVLGGIDTVGEGRERVFLG